MERNPFFLSGGICVLLGIKIKQVLPKKNDYIIGFLHLIAINSIEKVVSMFYILPIP